MRSIRSPRCALGDGNRRRTICLPLLIPYLLLVLVGCGEREQTSLARQVEFYRLTLNAVGKTRTMQSKTVFARLLRNDSIRGLPPGDKADQYLPEISSALKEAVTGSGVFVLCEGATPEDCIKGSQDSGMLSFTGISVEGEEWAVWVLHQIITDGHYDAQYRRVTMVQSEDGFESLEIGF